MLQVYIGAKATRQLTEENNLACKSKRLEKCSGKTPLCICPGFLLFPSHLPSATVRWDAGLDRSCFCLCRGIHTFLMFQQPLWNGNIATVQERNKQRVPS